MPKGAMRSPHWVNPHKGPRTFGTKYLNTVGKQVLSVAICDRCKFKFPYEELQPDPEFPGLRVCAADADWRDPYRLPARQTETITLRFPRPDESIAINVANDEQTNAVQLSDEDEAFYINITGPETAVDGKEIGIITATRQRFDPYAF